MDAITLAWTEAGQQKTQTFVDTYSTKNPGTIRIGRDPAQCDVVLPSLSAIDRTVSRLHVEIAFNPTHSCFYLRNLKPQNPVQVDGSAVAEEAVLQKGSVIRLGKVEVEVAAVASVPATIFVSASERPTLVYKPAEDREVEAERSTQRQKIQEHRALDTPPTPHSDIASFEPPTELEQPTARERQEASEPLADKQSRPAYVYGKLNDALPYSAKAAGEQAATKSSTDTHAMAGESTTASKGMKSLPADLPQQLFDSIPKPSVSIQSLLKPVPLAVSAAVLAAIGLLQWQRINTITSTQAFVNSSIIPLVAPVSGELRLYNISSGQLVQEGVLLGSISDPRNVELQRTQQRLKTEIENLIFRQQQLQAQLADRRDSFQRLENEANTQQSLQQGSFEFLEAELEDAIDAAQKAQADLVRVRQLETEGAAVTEQEIELAEEARASADDIVSQLREQLAAARPGITSNLQSSSVSALVANRRTALQNEIANFEQVLQNLRDDTDQKQQQFDSISERLSSQTPASIASPTDGKIWTVEYQPGLSNTVVVSGNLIAELAQCEGLWVEALVSARDATRISEGSDASIFIPPKGLGRQRLDGIVREIRTASDPVLVNNDEVAISPEELDPSEVAVVVDLKSQGSSGGFCNIGRTAEVRFSRN